MIFEDARLWFHIKVYTGKDEHEDGYPFKKGLSGYERRQ